MKLVDTHCHLDSEEYKDDLESVLNMVEKEMEYCVNIGCDMESCKDSINLAQKYDYIYATVGIHPIYISKITEEDMRLLESYLSLDKVVAIGEIGLDYHWMKDSKDVQKEWFRRQMDLARKYNKPVVIHSREAMEDTLEILKEYPDVKGVIHCYPGSLESAKEIIDRYYLGIGGVLTFKNAKKMVDVVKGIPLDRMVLETDSPYLTPVPHRGERNTPINVKYVAEKIAEIKGIDVEEVYRVTVENSKKLYGIKR